MKQIVTQAVVLRRINYQEADRIVTFLTPDQGKVTAMARGARRAKSKLAGSIELFGSSQITLLPGKGEISTLISARLLKNFDDIVKDLKRTELGYAVLKLINKHIEDEGDEDIFKLVVSTLEFLNNRSIHVDLTKIWFSLQFLNLTGHSPNLNVEDGKGNNKYIFESNKMMFIEDDQGSFDKNYIKVLRLALINDPTKLSKIRGLDKMLTNLVNITQTMLITTGFNPI